MSFAFSLVGQRKSDPGTVKFSYQGDSIDSIITAFKQYVESFCHLHKETGRVVIMKFYDITKSTEADLMIQAASDFVDSMSNATQDHMRNLEWFRHSQSCNMRHDFSGEFIKLSDRLTETRNGLVDKFVEKVASIRKSSEDKNKLNQFRYGGNIDEFVDLAFKDRKYLTRMEFSLSIENGTPEEKDDETILTVTKNF